MTSKEVATSDVKSSLFRYMMHNCGKNRVIIAKNEIPSDVDYSKANLIEFTLGNERYGFLKGKSN